MKPGSIKGYIQSCVINVKLRCKSVLSPLELNKRPSNHRALGGTRHQWGISCKQKSNEIWKWICVKGSAGHACLNYIIEKMWVISSHSLKLEPRSTTVGTNFSWPVLQIVHLKPIPKFSEIHFCFWEMSNVIWRYWGAQSQSVCEDYVDPSHHCWFHFKGN